MSVTRYEDGAPFVNAAAPTSAELSGYRVYRASSAILGGWTQLASVSTSTWIWTDSAGGATYYYHVRAENNSSLSHRSVIRSAGTFSAFIVDPDDRSYFEVLKPALSPIEGTPNQPITAYLVEASSRPEEMGGRVVKAVEFSASQGGVTPAPNFAVSGLGRVVAASLPAGPISNSRVWDPPAGVPGGVYIYQIEAEGRVFSGTIVILK